MGTNGIDPPAPSGAGGTSSQPADVRLAELETSFLEGPLVPSTGGQVVLLIMLLLILVLLLLILYLASDTASTHYAAHCPFSTEAKGEEVKWVLQSRDQLIFP